MALPQIEKLLIVQDRDASLQKTEQEHIDLYQKMRLSITLMDQ